MISVCFLGASLRAKQAMLDKRTKHAKQSKQAEQGKLSNKARKVSKVGKPSKLSMIRKLREVKMHQEGLIGAFMCKDPTSIWMQHPMKRAAHSKHHVTPNT